MRPIRALTAEISKAKFIALTLALTALSSNLRAQERLAAVPTTVADGESGVLLLQDGGLLAGRITRAANWYVVQRAGGEMQIPEARVTLVCRSPHEAYEYRCRSATPTTVEAHLASAEWCLRYDLPDEAGSELEGARKLESDHPRLALLDRRLAATKARLAKKVPAASSPSSPATTTESSPTLPVAPDLRVGVLETFTRKVQPVLVNNCTASKCHQSGSQQSFQLNRALLRGEANRRSTVQNLTAALALVDREHPEASPLLTVPRQTHGGMTGPVFGPRQDQAFKHLADWVALVAPQETPAIAPATAGTPKYVTPVAQLPPTIANPSRKDIASVGKLSEDENPAPIDDNEVPPAAATEDETISSLRPPHRLQYGGSLESWQPRDPFDPEIFNRHQRAQARH